MPPSDQDPPSEEELLTACCESFESWFQEQGWSGTAFEYSNGSEDLVYTSSDESVGGCSLVTSKGGEVQLNRLTPRRESSFESRTVQNGTC